jgi:LPXTG-motif cell wall-anchored protein
MPGEDLAVSLLVHTAKYAGVSIDNKMHKSIVNKSILLSAWVQVLGGLLLGGGVILWWFRRKQHTDKRRKQ